jgi:tripartite-type tricarboxylate transporter receptor subunit TctC
MVAPRATPPELIVQLNREINAGLASPRIRARYDELGLRIIAGSPQDFGRLVADDTDKWGKVIRAANIKLE